MPRPTSVDLESELGTALARLSDGRARVVIPGLSGLHRRRPGAHFHPTPEIFYQAGGGTDFECPSGGFRLRTGDLCVMPAGVPHAETPRDLRTRYRVVVVMREADGFMALHGEADRSRQIQSRNVTGYSQGGQAFQCLELASLANGIEPPLRQTYVGGLVTAFLTTVLTEMRNPSCGIEKPTPPVVREAEKIVRVELPHASLSVHAVAVRLGISPDHLTRLFKNTHGMSLGVWIAKERVQLACELLARPDHNISEVAWTCGFTSASYFIRVFRSHTGTTPKEWRMRTSKIRYPDPSPTRGRQLGRGKIV
ncbi:MAG: AraC family transcriptional regulator [Verrucomicrobiae bacterium]